MVPTDVESPPREMAAPIFAELFMNLPLKLTLEISPVTKTAPPLFFASLFMKLASKLQYEIPSTIFIAPPAVPAKLSVKLPVKSQLSAPFPMKIAPPVVAELAWKLPVKLLLLILKSSK